MAAHELFAAAPVDPRQAEEAWASWLSRTLA